MLLLGTFAKPQSNGVMKSNSPFNIIPAPNNEVISEGYFSLGNKTKIISQPISSDLGQYLIEKVKKLTGIVLTSDKKLNTKKNFIKFVLNSSANEAETEDYQLQIYKDSLLIKSVSRKGIFYGIQSLLQLLPAVENKRLKKLKIKIQCCEIIDKPRFKWRGLNLDCGRHFLSKDFIKRYIDLLAFYKMNTLHWHLSEDQGWRIEIKKYPLLHEIGAWRKNDNGDVYGGFYSQDDIKEIVSYAQSRFINIVPEIEMPGHCLASLSAYPENSCTGGPFEVSTQWGVFKDVYCAGRDSTFLFLEDILDEVVSLFPGKYFHIGGDEVPKDRWKECTKCQKRISDESLKDENELQSYFIKRIEKFLMSKGKRIVGWDEIIEGGLSNNAVVQSWRGFEGAIYAAKNGNFTIVSPASFTYFDKSIESLDLKKVYSFEPVPNELEKSLQKFILGSEANMWTEYAPQDKIDSKLFPRIIALAEVLWTEAKLRDYSDFYQRLQVHYEWLKQFNVDYGLEQKAFTPSIIFDKEKKEFLLQFIYGQQDLKLYYTLNGTEPGVESYRYLAPILIDTTRTIKVVAVHKEKITGNLRSISFAIHKGIGSKIQIENPYSDKYIAGGLQSITNGLRGSEDFRDGQWQGYEEVDFEAQVELPEITEVSKIKIGFLQNITSWIYLPAQVEIYFSDNGEEYILLDEINNDIPPNTSSVVIKDFSSTFEKRFVRFIKVRAKNIGRCPEWHQGAGGKAWLFIDEIIIE